jgi:hypothetical protein
MLCPADRAEKFSGYLFGGTSPFGLHDPSLRVFIEASLLSLQPTAQQQYVQGQVTETALPKEDAHLETYLKEVAEWNAANTASAGAASAAGAAASAPAAGLPEASKISPAWVCINGGERGTLVALSVRSIVQVLQPIPISVAKPHAAASPSPSPSPPVAAAAESAAASATPAEAVVAQPAANSA